MREEMVRVEGYRSMAKGWDGYDADPIASDVVDKAKRLVELLHDFPGPLNPCPAADGTICFEICWPDGRELWIDVGAGESMTAYIPKR